MAARRFPKFTETIIGWFIQGPLQEEILGDLQEYYEELEGPSWKTSIVFWFQVIHCVRPSLMKNIMSFKNYSRLGSVLFQIKFNLRTMRKNQVSTIISLLTIIIGVLGFQLTYSWITNEESMDQFHSKKDRIGVGVARLTPESNLISLAISRLYQIDYSEFPEIEDHISIHTYMPGEIQFEANAISYSGKGLVVDSSFLDFFDFELARGDKKVLSDPKSIIITEDFGFKTFGEIDPIGQIVKINCDQEGSYRVAAIAKRIPSNSSLTFDFIIPKHSQEFWRRAPQDVVLLKEGFLIDQLNTKLNHFGETSERFPNSEVFLYPFKDIYQDHPINISLFSKYGDANNLNTIKFIAWALLLITIICFTNLQTSVQIASMDQVKLKQVIGAAKRQLISEWMIRGLIYGAISLAISISLYYSCFEFIVQYLKLELDLVPNKDLLLIFGATMATVLISFQVASSHVLNRIRKPIIQYTHKIQKIGFSRNALAIVQYAVTILVLIGSVIISLQFDYLVKKDLGIQQSEVVSVKFFDIIPNARQDSIERARILEKYQTILRRLDQNPNISSVSQGLMPFGYAYDLPFKTLGSLDDFTPIKTLNADPGFINVFELELVEGRFYDERDENNALSFVINEAAKDYFKIENIHDAKLTYKGNNEQYQVIGVVKDFHFEHLSQEIKPLILPYFIRTDNEIIIRYQKEADEEVIQFLEHLYREVNPNGIFTANFFSDRVSNQYAEEKKVKRIYSLFGLIALLLSSVTLFSFVYHEAKRRTKEMGIRKVVGANMTEIFKLISYSFFKSMGISLIISIPIGWYLMDLWLQNFANRIDQKLWMYLFISIVVMIWAMGATLWHTTKVAKLNPVQSLRYE